MNDDTYVPTDYELAKQLRLDLEYLTVQNRAIRMVMSNETKFEPAKEAIIKLSENLADKLSDCQIYAEELDVRHASDGAGTLEYTETADYHVMELACAHCEDVTEIIAFLEDELGIDYAESMVRIHFDEMYEGDEDEN
tara:strand:- start:11206 stop:11619 length:414 start_codon:yes stop_codon:yes gene_type:complete